MHDGRSGAPVHHPVLLECRGTFVLVDFGPVGMAELMKTRSTPHGVLKPMLSTVWLTDSLMSRLVSVGRAAIVGRTPTSCRPVRPSKDLAHHAELVGFFDSNQSPVSMSSLVLRGPNSQGWAKYSTPHMPSRVPTTSANSTSSERHDQVAGPGQHESSGIDSAVYLGNRDLAQVPPAHGVGEEVVPLLKHALLGAGPGAPVDLETRVLVGARSVISAIDFLGSQIVTRREHGPVARQDDHTNMSSASAAKKAVVRARPEAHGSERFGSLSIEHHPRNPTVVEQLVRDVLALRSRLSNHPRSPSCSAVPVFTSSNIVSTKSYYGDGPVNWRDPGAKAATVHAPAIARRDKSLTLTLDRLPPGCIPRCRIPSGAAVLLAHALERRGGERDMVGNSGSASTVDIEAAVREGEGHWSLDPTQSRVEFHVKHFWGAITVHGRFERFEGEGTVAPDGTISGRLVIDATSLTTKNRRRDEHLRSADFFDVEQHPTVVASVSDVAPTGSTAVRGAVTVEAAGREQEFEATMSVLEASPEAVTLRCELVVDRTVHAMTWSPLGMASRSARAVVTARFVRQ